jgi:hypothetical protein
VKIKTLYTCCEQVGRNGTDCDDLLDVEQHCHNEGHRLGRGRGGAPSDKVKEETKFIF